MIRFITRNKVYDVSIDPLALSPDVLSSAPDCINVFSASNQPLMRIVLLIMQVGICTELYNSRIKLAE